MTSRARNYFSRGVPPPIQYVLAARNGDISKVKRLLNQGVNVNTRHDPNRTALSWAAGSGHNNIVKHLINKGATINSRDTNGMTPLMRAAVSGREAVVRTLLNAGANINAQSESGMTALMFAVLWKHPGVIRILLDQKARVNLMNTRHKRAANIAMKLTPNKSKPNNNQKIKNILASFINWKRLSTREVRGSY